MKLETLVLRPFCFSFSFFWRKTLCNLSVGLPFSAGISWDAEGEHHPQSSIPVAEWNWWHRCWGPGFCFLNRRFTNSIRFQLDFTFCTSQALAKGLQHNMTLTILDLKRNQITDSGAEAPGFAFFEGTLTPCTRFHILHIAGFSQCTAAQ